MTKRSCLFALVFVIFYAVCAGAQYAAIADKVVQKYTAATCEQLWEKKSQKTPATPQEQQAITILKQNPDIRAAFINKIAPPIANKIFDCGMIPK